MHRFKDIYRFTNVNVILNFIINPTTLIDLSLLTSYVRRFFLFSYVKIKMI